MRAGDTRRYYRTDYGRWVVADCAGWLPGSWRFKWLARWATR